jgi:hypothetical protein
MELEDIAARLVHHVHRTMILKPEEIESEWRYKNGFEFKHLESLASNVVYRGKYFKFEREVSEIKRHLPTVIEPKSFWKRLFG